MPWDSASGDAVAGAPGAPASWRGSALRAAFACAALSALFWLLGRGAGNAPQLHGQLLRPRPAPTFAGLLDTSGRPFAWAAQRGRAVLVFFGYTHCPDVCPLTMARLARVLDSLGDAARRVRVVFVSLDPQRDTPRILRAYLDALLPAAVGLRGSAAQTARAAAQWRVRYRRVYAPGAAEDRGSYWLDHTAAVTLVGPHGRLRARYGYAQIEAHALLRGDLLALLGHRAGATSPPPR